MRSWKTEDIHIMSRYIYQRKMNEKTNEKTPFPNAGKLWTIEEDETLRTRFLDDRCPIMELALAHGRTVGAIIARLQSRLLIPVLSMVEQYRTYIKGYTEYENDTEFRQLEKDIAAAKRKKKESTHFEQGTQTQITLEMIYNEIITLRKDFHDLRKDFNTLREDFDSLQ